MATRRQLLATGLAAVGATALGGCATQSAVAGNGRPPKVFGVAIDPWKASDWAKAVGAKPTTVMEFESWDRNRTLDSHFQAAHDDGMKSFIVTWEPWAPVDTSKGLAAEGALQEKFSNQAIVAGQLDQYIRTFATSVKNSGLTVYVRYAHEMTGNWYPWFHDPAVYVQAWRHVVDQFRSVGATNAKFIFAPSENLYQKGDSDFMALVQQYWPGPDHVDYIGTTMVNAGGQKTYSVEQFLPRLTMMHSAFGKDGFLAEVNSASTGRVKFFSDLRTWLATPDADWIKGVVLSQLPSRTQAVNGDTVGNLSWQVTDDPDTKPIIRAMVKDITGAA